MKKIRELFSGSGKKNEAYSQIPPPFMNDQYKALEVNYDNFFTHESSKIDTSEPLKKQIKRISFEISNICNYSGIHKKCPASICEKMKVLPSEIVYKTIDEVAGFDYGGVFSFHRYNEPLIDPRLFDFIKYAKSKCNNSKILILTNGSHLTQEIADELAALGVWILAVSAYSVSEYERFIKLKVEVPYYVFFSILDDRFDIYSSEPAIIQSSCFAPIGDITVNAFGEVVLCCLDWKNKYVFGDLKNETLNEIINKESFIKTNNDLKNENRNLDICKRCTMNR